VAYRGTGCGTETVVVRLVGLCHHAGTCTSLDTATAGSLGHRPDPQGRQTAGLAAGGDLAEAILASLVESLTCGATQWQGGTSFLATGWRLRSQYHQRTDGLGGHRVHTCQSRTPGIGGSSNRLAMVQCPVVRRDGRCSPSDGRSTASALLSTQTIPISLSNAHWVPWASFACPCLSTRFQ